VTYNKWANLIQHQDAQPTDRSPPYTDETYHWENENFIGELTFAVSNDQGDNYASAIPHYEMASRERGSHAKDKYTVTNATRSKTAVVSPENCVMGVPLEVPFYRTTTL